MSDSSKIILSEKFQQSFEALPIFVFLKAYVHFEMMEVVSRVLVLPDMQAHCLAREPWWLPSFLCVLDEVVASRVGKNVNKPLSAP